MSAHSAAALVFDELRSIQALLSGPAAPPAAATYRAAAAALPAPLRLPSADATEEDELPSRQPVGSPPKQATRERELKQEVAALREQHAEQEARCKRLEEALQAAQHDGELVAHRLQTQLNAKQEETGHLAELVFQLREEVDSLRHQLQCNAQEAQHGDQSALDSIAQLQEAAAEWRRQGEEGLELLAEERARSMALQHDSQQAQQHAEQLEREVQEERQQRLAAEAELASLKAALGGPAGSAALVAELRQRLQMERGWRKAVSQWLQGEMQTRNELERVLVNVGTAVRVGGGRSSSEDGTNLSHKVEAAPPLPPRRMAASQLTPVSVFSDAATAPAAAPPQTAPGSRVTVTVHSPRQAACVTVDSTTGGGSSSGSKAGSRVGWRQHFQATVKAFDERHAKLQQELSELRREALQPASGTA